MEQKSRYTTLFVIGTILLVALFLYSQRDAIYAQLDEWYLIPRPERFTELYLENYTQLPKAVVAGQVVPFSFTIHNLEGKEMAYEYWVYALKDGEERVTVDQQTVSAAHDEYKTIDVTYQYPASTTSAVIYVDLIDLDQQIHFKLSAE